jgi:hypothetical protein
MTVLEVETGAIRKAQLRAASEAFFAALNRKDFEAIPYDENVVFRAPIAPGGRHFPLIGREALRTIWWPPLIPILWEVTVIEHYFNEELTAIVTEADIHTRNPRAALRVADRFVVDREGMIVAQENHFDPRDVTDPGWRGA